MATATVIRAWQDASSAYLAVSVSEGGNQGNKEYIGSVSLTDDLALVGFPGKTWTQLSAAEKKTALIAACKAVRDAQQATQSAIGGISGTVTL
jgi:hypothetical protein